MYVIKYPHPLLSYKCKPLRKIDKKIRDVVSEMFKLMYENSGVGLAANQVGLPYQLVVLNQTGNSEQKKEEYVLINPTILKLKGGSEEGEEGCLSFPGLRMVVPRAREVKFQAIDLNGRLCSYHWNGFQARIVQHETDHLFGMSFFQRANASITPNFELFLAKMSKNYRQDLGDDWESVEEQIWKNVAKWESERT